MELEHSKTFFGSLCSVQIHHDFAQIARQLLKTEVREKIKSQLHQASPRPLDFLTPVFVEIREIV
jgi:hypothetical protein